MAIHPRQFGIVLKNARMDKKLTQAELAEILDISLPYLKDLERFRGYLSPSSTLFPSLASPIPKFTAVVVLATPPF